MSDSNQTIPFERLPEGFAETLEHPPEAPAPARPAATVVLMRDGTPGLEILLLRRNRATGFVPGAYVFPGGRVDTEDSSGKLVERLRGLTPEEAERRLQLGNTDPPAIAYYIAAIREAFEEAGLLIGKTTAGEPAPSLEDNQLLHGLWEVLLEDETAFPHILDEMGCVLDGEAMEYIAHWVTPVVEPRRYDTRFFAAAVSPEQDLILNEREMVDAVWLTPGVALERYGCGTLPMIFPTIRTLEQLVEFSNAEEVLAHFRNRDIPTTLPRLVKTEQGVRMEV